MSNTTSVSFIGRGGFSQYIQQLVATDPQLKNVISIQTIHSTANPFSGSSSSPLSAVYICTPDHTHTQLLEQVLNAKANVFVEKPAFFSLQHYKHAVEQSKKEGLHVQINFQRRFDTLYLSARQSLQTALQDELTAAQSASNPPIIRVHLTAKDPVPHENDPYKYLYNSVIHDLDTAAWLAYPFVESKVVSVDFDKTQTLRVELLFKKKVPTSSSDLFELPVSITFCKGNASYLNRIEVHTSLTHATFEEDYCGNVFFDRYQRAYVQAWLNFHHEVQARKFASYSGAEDQSSEYSIHHPTFSATYQLLEDALKICKEKVQVHSAS